MLTQPIDNSFVAFDFEATLHSPFAYAFGLLGDRWTLRILQNLFTGAKRFDELRNRTQTTRGTLSSRLSHMVSIGLVYKNPHRSQKSIHEYGLTDKGLNLYPTALLFWKWECRWGQGASTLPSALTHSVCGHTFEPLVVCSDCGQEVHSKHCTFELCTLQRHANTPPITLDNRRRSGPAMPLKEETGFHSIEVLGDKWTGLIVSTLWFRERRFDEIVRALNISTNILANRLKLLAEYGILSREVGNPMSNHPIYKLTLKGRDLFGIAMLLHQWGERWVAEASPPTLEVRHRCGAKLRPLVVCSHCAVKIQHREVLSH